MANENRWADGIQEWINYCYEMLKDNPYPAQMDNNNTFEKHLELAVKSKIYHTAIYEYKLKLDKMLRDELEVDAAEE